MANPTTTGLRGWWKADAITSPPADGAALTSWTDSSGNNTPFTASTAAPTYVASGAVRPNGLPAVRFAGASEMLSAAANNTATTKLVVLRVSAYGAGSSFYCGSSGSGVELGISGTGKFDTFVGNTIVNRTGTGTGTAIPLDTWHILTVVANGSNSTDTYVDGALDGPTSTAGYTATATASLLGSGGGGGYFNGYIAEVMDYSRVLTTQELSDATAYLTAKYLSTAAARARVYRVSVAGDVIGQRALARLYRVGVSSVAVNNRPVVSVNPSTLSVDAGADFSLTGFDSDVDGTVVSRQWTLNGQPLGTAGILQVRAPVSTADQTLTYVYTVTDNSGDSTSVSVPVTVRRAPITIKKADGTLAGRVYRTFTADELAAFYAPAPVVSQRNIIRRVVGTVQNDGVPVVSGGLAGYELVQNGGGTLNYDAASAMGGRIGIKAIPAAGAVLNAYQDFWNINPVLTFGYAWTFTEAGTPLLVTFDRFFPDFSHGTVNLSLQRTATRNLRVLEAGTGTPLDITSIGTIPSATPVWVEGKLDATNGQVTVTIYQLGTTTVLAQVVSAAGAWKVPFTVQSRRCGMGNAGAFTSFAWNDRNHLGFGSYAPRLDIDPTLGDPGPTNTGHFPGPLTRSPATGYSDLIITTAGTYRDLEVYGLIKVQHQSGTVIIDNLVVRGQTAYTDVTALIDTNGVGPNATTIIRNVTVVPDVADPNTVGVDGRFQASRLRIEKVQDGMRPRGTGGSIEDCWLHWLVYFIVAASRATSLQTHNDLLQLAAAIGWTIRRNRLDAHYGPGGTRGPNGELFPTINTDTSKWGANNTHPEISCFMVNISGTTPSSGNIIEDNICSGGYTPWNSGNNGSATNPAARIWRNTFSSLDQHGNPAIILRFNSFQTGIDLGVGTPNANVYSDGPTVGQPVPIRMDGDGVGTVPAASFTRTPASGTAPQAVQFTDTSTGNPTAWSWAFGDGTTSTAQSPSHTYTAPGTYTAVLTASAAGGSSSTTSATVTVAASSASGPVAGWWSASLAGVPTGTMGAHRDDGTTAGVELRKQWDYWDSAGGSVVDPAVEGIPDCPGGTGRVVKWQKVAGSDQVYQKLNRTFTDQNWPLGSASPVAASHSPSDPSGVYVCYLYIPSSDFVLNPSHGWVQLLQFKENYVDSAGTLHQDPIWAMGANNLGDGTIRANMFPHNSPTFPLSDYMDRWVKWEFRLYQGAADTTGHGGRIEMRADGVLLDTGYESTDHIGSAAYVPLSQTRGWVWIAGPYTSNQTTGGVPDYMGTHTTTYVGRSWVGPVGT